MGKFLTYLLLDTLPKVIRSTELPWCPSEGLYEVEMQVVLRHFPICFLTTMLIKFPQLIKHLEIYKKKITYTIRE